MTLLAVGSSTSSFNFWWYGAAGLYKVHRVWKWAVLGKTYGKSENWLGLTIGHGLDCYIGNTFFSRWPFVAFLVGKRFLDFMQQKDAVEKTYGDWKRAFRFTHPVYMVETNSSIAHSKIKVWFRTPNALLIRIERVVLATLNMASELFKLVMRIMDVLELVTFDRQQYEELLRISVQQAPLNIYECMEALNYNEDVFLQRLEQEKTVIEMSMKVIGMQVDSESVVKNVRKFFEWSKSAQTQYKKMSSLVGDVVVDLFKLVIQSAAPDDMKNVVNKALNFDPENNAWMKNAKRYDFPANRHLRVRLGDTDSSSPIVTWADLRPAKNVTQATAFKKSLIAFDYRSPVQARKTQQPRSDYATPTGIVAV